MRAHTVVLLHAGFAWEDIADAAMTLRLPVLAFYTADEPDTGQGVCAPIKPTDRPFMADTVSELYRMVALPDPPASPLAFTRERLFVIRDALKRLEAAASSATSDDMNSDVYEAAEQLRSEVEKLVFGLESWGAEQ